MCCRVSRVNGKLAAILAVSHKWKHDFHGFEVPGHICAPLADDSLLSACPHSAFLCERRNLVKQDTHAPANEHLGHASVSNNPCLGFGSCLEKPVKRRLRFTQVSTLAIKPSFPLHAFDNCGCLHLHARVNTQNVYKYQCLYIFPKFWMLLCDAGMRP